MPRSRTLSHEPAFVLHQYPWSESSLILEVYTRQHGRLAVVAKGVKRPTSSFRPVLLPLQPLSLHIGGEGDIRTLKGAEWQGGHVMPTGDALLSGFYLNELLLRLLPRDDPHPALFDVYRQTVWMLAQGGEGAVAPALRAFELMLLREMGVLPSLQLQTLNMQAVQASGHYDLVPEAGLRDCGASQAWEDQRHRLMGNHWLALQEALQGEHAFADLVRLLAQWSSEDRSALQQQLRVVVHHHCGMDVLKTRQLMMDLQSL